MPLLWLQAGEKAFELPSSFSLVAHFAFGVTGALAGLRRGYDIVGVLFLAMVTAIGGGLIRDGILISSGPASILTQGSTLLVVLAAALLTLVLHPLFDRLQSALAVIDAVGLGAFAVYGAQRSLDAGLSYPAAVLGGTITAVGGSLLRDILAREEPLLLKPGQFYALVAIGGCCLYLGLPYLGWMSHDRAAVLSIVAVFLVRILAIRFDWRTRPLGPEPPPQVS
jgi:uncharacterized membrane protein YeiH